ncbi:hypothetical protein SuNHUV7_05260 (plasmid) [Pseudoseohaeicola sp. NH-UV-7]
MTATRNDQQQLNLSLAKTEPSTNDTTFDFLKFLEETARLRRPLYY